MKTVNTGLGLLLLVACGGKGQVDLGGNQTNAGWANTKGRVATPTVTGQNNVEPQTLYDGGDEVEAIAVDETTVVAAIGSVRTWDTRLKMCQLADCQGTLETIEIVPELPSSNLVFPFVISYGEVFWSNPYASGQPTISVCQAQGCNGEVRQIPTVGPVSALVAGADSVYWTYWDGTNTVVARCPRSGCASPQMLPLPDPITHALGQWRTRLDLDETNGLLYVSSDTAIARVQADLAAEPTLFYQGQATIGGVAVNAGFVYFDLSTLLGEIRRCPVAGCEMGSEHVVSAPRWPSMLAADERSLYWLHKADTNAINPGGGSEHGDSDPGAISSSSIDGSSGVERVIGPIQIHEAWRWGRWACGPLINSRYVFWCEVVGSTGSELSLNIRMKQR